MTKAPPESQARRESTSLIVTRRFEGSRGAAEVLASLVRLHSGKERTYESPKN